MEPQQNVAGNMFSREDAIRAMTCVSSPMGCGRTITEGEFDRWDNLSRQEYKQSGWCRDCQDKYFGQCVTLDCKHEGEDGCACQCNCMSVDIGVGTLYSGSYYCPLPVHRDRAERPDHKDRAEGEH